MMMLLMLHLRQMYWTRRARPTASMRIQASWYSWMAAQHPPAAITITDTTPADPAQCFVVNPCARLN